MFSEKWTKSTYGIWTSHLAKMKSKVYEIVVLINVHLDVRLSFMTATVWASAQAEQSFL